MAGDIWEQAVENYLATDRGLFLNPQYLVGKPGEWEAVPDFLAVAFPDSAVWMVEVTKAPKGRLFGKFDAFEKDYVPRIKEQMQTHLVVRGDDPWSQWTVGLWVFAPAATLPGVKSRMDSAGVQKKLTTALEDTLIPNWDVRFR